MFSTFASNLSDEPSNVLLDSYTENEVAMDIMNDLHIVILLTDALKILIHLHITYLLSLLHIFCLFMMSISLTRYHRDNTILIMLDTFKINDICNIVLNLCISSNLTNMLFLKQ